MKVTKIKNLCKAEKNCLIYKQGGRTLIGTRNVAYLSEGLEITKKSIKTLFDWPTVEVDIDIEERKMNESRMLPMEMYKAHLIELKPGWEITGGNATVVPLMHAMGLCFVRKEYVDAAEKTEGYTSYHLGENIDGEPLIIVGDGLVTTAIIKPETRRAAGNIRDYLSRMSSMMVFGWPDEHKPGAEDKLKGQIDMDEMLEEAKDNDGAAGDPHRE